MSNARCSGGEYGGAHLFLGVGRAGRDVRSRRPLVGEGVPVRSRTSKASGSGRGSAQGLARPPLGSSLRGRSALAHEPARPPLRSSSPGTAEPSSAKVGGRLGRRNEPRSSGRSPVSLRLVLVPPGRVPERPRSTSPVSSRKRGQRARPSPLALLIREPPTKPARPSTRLGRLSNRHPHGPRRELTSSARETFLEVVEGGKLDVAEPLGFALHVVDDLDAVEL